MRFKQFDPLVVVPWGPARHGMLGAPGAGPATDRAAEPVQRECAAHPAEASHDDRAGPEVNHQ
eukprot:9985793-Alexandrium_andersonii.AAC.1